MFDNGRFTRVPSPHLGPVYAIAGDGHGGVWVSSFDQGVVHVVGGKVVERMSFEEGGGGLGGSGLVPDSNGGVWIALIRGALVYFRGGRILQRLTHRDGLGEGFLVNLQRDSDGALWASMDGGFSRIVDGRIATMTTANGLPCNEGQWIIEDDAASYWLNMRCGLVRIARSDLRAWAANPQRRIEVTAFDRTDGVRLSRVQIERPVVTKSADGRIWMSYPGMLGLIDPANLPTNAIPPPVHIERITADETTFEAAPGLRLRPNVRDFGSTTRPPAWSRRKRFASVSNWKGRTRLGPMSSISAPFTTRISRRVTTGFTSRPPTTTACGTSRVTCSSSPSPRRITRRTDSACSARCCLQECSGRRGGCAFSNSHDNSSGRWTRASSNARVWRGNCTTRSCRPFRPSLRFHRC